MLRSTLLASAVLFVSLLSVSPAAKAVPPDPQPEKPPAVSDCVPPDPQPNDPPCTDKMTPRPPKPPAATSAASNLTPGVPPLATAR